MKDLLSYLWPHTHTNVIQQFATRDVSARYRRSWLGLTWLFLAPLLMLVLYTLVFRHVFQVRWGVSNAGNMVFALHLYAGLAVFNFFAECVNRAPHLILEQPHLVKKVVFPVEILAWASVGAALVQLGAAGLVLVLLRLLGTGSVPVTVLTLPVVWLPLLPLCLGLSWGLSALGTYVRDVSQLVGMGVSALVFISPVFFPVEALPQKLQGWMWLNPLAPVMTQTRAVLLDGRWPDWTAWAGNGLYALALAGTGAWIFKKLRPGFADVL